MKVGFDISQISHQGGVSTYTANLAEMLADQKGLEMVYFYSSLRKPLNKAFKSRLKNVKTFRLPPTLFEVLFNKVRNIPIEKFIGEIDIFHSSDWVQPPTKAKKVTTYHDLVPLKYPEWSHPKIVKVHKRRLKLVEKEIDMVIAVSEATKKDLLELSDIREDKIKVVYEGVSKNYKKLPEEEVAKFKKKYDLPDKFILSIGGVGQRRNLDRIREACRGYNLIITGENLPWLPDYEMPFLYNSAEALLYVSLYEGFGLPIVEAMACGVPVITSNLSAMEEIGTGAAMLVDPYEADKIKEGVEIVMKDNGMRKDLIKAGFKKSAQFSWKKCVQKTVEIYRGLLGE